MTTMNVPFVDLGRAYQALGHELDDRLLEVARGGHYILGPNMAALEAAVADYLGLAHAVAVNSGTDALFLALCAAGIGPGDEVVTTPFTFSATLGTIEATGATPVLVDIEPTSFNIDPKLIEGAVTAATRAILPVHMFGLPAEMRSVMEIASRHGLQVIEDCAQSLGARLDGRPAGSFAALNAFSFYPTKTLGCLGDGGMVATADAGLHQSLLSLRNHGADPEGEYVRQGYNSRLDELQAAVLRVKLERLDDMNERRRQIAAHYGQELTGLAKLQQASPGAHHVYGYYTIQVPERDRVRAKLREAGVATALYYGKPLHHHPHHARHCRWEALPVAEEICRHCLSLPIFPEMTDAEVEYVAATTARVIREVSGD